MKTTLTDQQKNAVTSDAAPLVVLAGAGSGKTTVLVERFLRLVVDAGVPPSRILAATFTERAASEMKERAAESLGKMGRPDLIAELNAAPICTLHSFCSRLIAPHTLKLGLDPNFSILDSYQARLLQEDALTEVLSRWRKEHLDKIQVLVEHLYWPDEHRPRPGRQAASKGFAREFMELVEAVRCAGRSDCSPLLSIHIDTKTNQKSAEALLHELETVLSSVGGIPAKSIEKAKEVLSYLAGYLNTHPPEQKILLHTLLRLSKISTNVAVVLKDLLGKVKNDLAPALLDEYFADSYNLCAQTLNELYADFSSEYRQNKLIRGGLDFLDLEETVLQILRSGDKSVPLDYILVDETQDLNNVQWEIIRHLEKTAPVFTVGDLQQSIYGFRYADVKEFADFAAGAKSRGGELISLPQNFRSRASILSVVNQLFERIWEDKSKAPFLRLEAELSYPQHSFEGVELLVAAGKDRQDARKAEARGLITRLGALKQDPRFQIYDIHQDSASGKQTFRARSLEWKDILVLVRSSSSFEYLENACKDAGIPLVVLAGQGFWDALEISDLLALLTALEDPYDSFSLACVLRSPAVAFTDDDLLELRVSPRHLVETEGELRWHRRELYEGLQQTADEQAAKESLAGRSSEFLKTFNRLYHLKDRIPLRKLLEIWIRKQELEALYSSQPQGGLILSNISKFLRLCSSQTGLSSTSLRSAFEEIRTRELHEGIAPDPISEEGAIRAMTVHGAKGLEAPVVAIFDMNYEPRSAGGAFVFNRLDGAAFTLLTGAEDNGKYLPSKRQEIATENKSSREGEDQRVLYVAMTRAREKLLLSASCVRNKTDDANKKFRTTGWLKLLVDQLDLDLEMIFSEVDDVSGPLPLINATGGETGMLLVRSWQQRSLEQKGRPTGSSGGSAVPKPPAGFPAPIRRGYGPIAVVDWLRMQQGQPIRFLREESDFRYDNDEEDRGVQFGVWVHRLLEIMPEESADLRDIAIREAALLFNRTPHPDELDRVLRLLTNFRNSSIRQRIRSAKRVLREFPLLLELNNTLLRAKLDLAIEDEDGWTILDYKSDRVSPSQVAERNAIYLNQLQIYALGWEKLTGRLPKEAMIFYLDPDLIIPVSLEPETLAAVLQMTN